MNLNEKIDNMITEEYAGLPAITDPSMQKTVKTVINNTLKVISEDAPATSTNAVDQYTPVLISLIRRTLPTLVGPQMIGMQAMNMPTGRIFVQRVYAIDRANNQKWEVWGGTGEPALRSKSESGIDGRKDIAPFNSMETLAGEDLGWKNYATTGDKTLALYPEMSFGIDSMDVFTKTRKLKGRITLEVMQDLRAVHGQDAEAELANILQAEIAAEIDREIVGRIWGEAEIGAENCTTTGLFDFSIDADGRWAAEKVTSLLLQIEREATIIAQRTRRGRGNFILTSPEVAAYLSMSSLITWVQNTGFASNIVNPVSVSYYGMLCNRFKVFVDPYLSAATQEDAKITSGSVLKAHALIVGYKGNTVYDSGLFYCPYVPIQWWKATGEEDGGQRLGVMSRYGLISNPYTISNPPNHSIGQPPYGDNYTTTRPGTYTSNNNAYFRKFYVKF